MPKINDGGPAFPLAGFADLNGNVQYPEYGMSLRAWYTGQALVGILAGYWHNPPAPGTGSAETVAADAVATADAVLARLARDGDE